MIKQGSTPLPTKTLTEQLSSVEDKLHNLLACYQFYDHAIRAMTNPEQLDESQEWYFWLVSESAMVTAAGGDGDA